MKDKKILQCPDKKKIIYISPDCFFDTDFPILPEINKKYNLIWIPIIPATNSRYSKNEIKIFSEKHNISYQLQIKKGRRRQLKQFGFSFKLLRIARKEKPDIIYTEYLGDIYIAILSMIMLNRNKLVYAIHDVISHTNLSSFIEDILQKIVRRYCKNFHLFSKNQANIFISMFPDKKIFYAPFALKNFGKPSCQRPIINSQCNFLFFGNIKEYKGLDLLINAIEELALEGFSNFKLTIAGKGDHWKNCKQLIKNHNLYDLKIEYIPNSSIPDLFQANHYLVLPYRDVTQSGPQMIAYNYCLPVIASDFDGFKEVIEDKKTGFLFKKENIKDLKRTLKKCLKMKDSEYSLIRSNLHNYVVLNYEINKITQRYHHFFDSVIEQNESKNCHLFKRLIFLII